MLNICSKKEKTDNLYKLVNEYEIQQKQNSEKRSMARQKVCISMEELALERLSNMNAQYERKAEGWSMWSPNDVWRKLLEYTWQYYDNMEAELIGKYAAMYNEINIVDCPVVKPLPHITDVMKPVPRYVHTKDFFDRYVFHFSVPF